MATQVLRPQDCLVERFGYYTKGNGFSYTKTNHIINNNYGNKKSTMVQTSHKKRYHNNQSQQNNCSTSPKKIPTLDESKYVSRERNTKNDVEIGQVSIVRRGDSLDSLDSRIKKDMTMTKKSSSSHEILYAGSACSVSPSPSSLPLPTFFKKQDLKPFDDSATRDLRRLLRLE